MPATDSTALRLLVAAPMLYHPHCGNGGGVLCFELLRRLAMRAEVHFVGFAAASQKNDNAALVALRGAVRSVKVVSRPAPLARGAASMLLQLCTGLPREVRDLRSSVMRAALSEVAIRERVHCIILQFPHMAQFVDAVPGVPVVVDVQDACLVSRYREWRSSQEAAQGLARQLQRLHSWWAWARYELRTYARAQRLMALSDTDLGVLRAFLPRVPAFFSPVAWDPVAAPAAGGEGRVLFMGNFAHAPNADGLRWLLAEVWPRVRAECPQALLQVAGPNLPASFASNATDGVQSLGFVEDVRPLLGGATLSLVPYRFGGGVKIKTLEAMALGCPVVATSVGCEGLGAVDGVHLRVADGPEAFAEAVVELLRTPALRQTLAHQALALVTERFSWQHKLDALLQELRTLGLEHARRSLAAGPMA